MNLQTEGRVDHFLRHLNTTDAKKIKKIFHFLEEHDFNSLREHFKINKLHIPNEQIFMLRAATLKNYRILFRYEQENTLVIEDIVSRDFLKTFFH